ncbi:MAG: hypothetical protein GJ680_07425 [Alteromonadaceae bacterium]|nr:hypothetical protein [Alteromonadaceae bacterium]
MYKSVIALAMVSATTVAQQNLPDIPIEDVRAGRMTAEQVAERNTAPAQPATKADAFTQSEIEAFMAQINAQVPGFTQEPQSTLVTPANNRGYIYEQAERNYKPTQRYDVKPLDSFVIPVGAGSMNSIKTNYKYIASKTSDKYTILEPDGGFLYVTTTRDMPVGLILFEEGVPESQISVTLVPIDAPPAVIDIEIAISEQMALKGAEFQRSIDEKEAFSNAQQEQFAYANDHTRRIAQMLVPVAQGDLPPGFSLSVDVPYDMKIPCAMAIYHEAKQRLMGGNEVIDVVHVVNDGDRTYQIREEMCLSDDTIAVGLFERSYLEPGQEMELYILRNRYFQAEKQREFRRPRVTSGE